METDKTKLICLPHAGGYADGYTKLKQFIDDRIEPVFIEYPGHGRKFREPLLRTLEDLRDFVIDKIMPHIDARYAFYGHSMGGRISWLVANKLREMNKPLPEAIFISGAPAPSAPFLKPEDVDFRTITNMTGPNIDALRELFEPIIAADVKAVDDYVYEKNEPLSLPFTVFYGKEDTFPAEDFQKWEIETTFDLDLIPFAGDHFFNFKYLDEIMSIINRKLFSEQ